LFGAKSIIKISFLRFFGKREDKMSLDKFFENPFEDYTSENACCVIEDGAIKCDCKIACQLNEKWKNTLAQFKYLDYNDYSVYTGTAGVALLKLKKDPDSKQNLQV
jgi:hypothetical protein